MTDNALDAVLAQIRQAQSLLSVAEQAWPHVLECADAPEAALLEDLLHIATHETQSHLGFLVQDIDGLLARLALRRKYAQFSHAEIDRIVAQGWSTPLVQSLHDAHPDLPLAELSAAAKELCREWAALKPPTATWFTEGRF